jgi:XTP/dITP diphosphohydrolase
MAGMGTVRLVTKNSWKVQIARHVVERQYGIVVQPTGIELGELQHDDPTVIARSSAVEAYRRLGEPVLKCDSGLRIPGLGGFPGPYSNYVERTLGIGGLLQACARLTNRRAAIYAVVAFCDGDLEPAVFHGVTVGTLLETQRGEFGYFFDSIFVPEGHDRTLAEFPDDERWVFWKEAFERFARWYVGGGAEP